MPHSRHRSVGALSDTAIRLSVRPSVTCPYSENGAYGYYRTLTGNLMLKVEPTGQRDHTITGSGRNGLDLEKFMSLMSRKRVNTNRK